MRQILLVGGLNKAKSLASSLVSRGYRIIIVNRDAKDCEALAADGRFAVYCGDGTKPFVLEDVGADQVDIAIALTARDEDNLVICELCKKRFQVPKTVALVSDPKKISFFHDMGIDSAVCAVSTLTSVIEQHTFIEEMNNAISVGNGRVQIIELRIEEGDYAVHRQIQNLGLPREVILGSILRGDQVVIPRGNTQILAHDQLVILTSATHEKSVISQLKRGRV